MESGSLKRADIDLVARTLVLRGDVVKNHNELTLPLSALVHEILSKRLKSQDGSSAARRRRRPRSSEYVFPSFGKKCPYITDARAMMERLSEVSGRHVTPQDLRRTAEDIAKYCKVDPDERRQLLNHLASDVHGTHYSNNPDPKVLAPAVEAMAQWVLEQAAIAAGETGIPLRVAA